MKDWIGYHNTEKVGTTYISLGESVLYSGVTTGTPKSGDRVWVIEGIGKKKMYRLVDCFIVDRCETTIDPLIKHKSKKLLGKKV